MCNSVPCWSALRWQSLIFISITPLIAAKSLQLYLTLCDPIDGRPPGSPVPGILQARILEWVAISFSNAWKGKVKVKSLSPVGLLATPWTAAYQVPPSHGIFKARVLGWGAIALDFLRHQGRAYWNFKACFFLSISWEEWEGGCKSADRLLYQANYLLSELFLFPLISLNAQYF